MCFFFRRRQNQTNVIDLFLEATNGTLIFEGKKIKFFVFADDENNELPMPEKALENDIITPGKYASQCPESPRESLSALFLSESSCFDKNTKSGVRICAAKFSDMDFNGQYELVYVNGKREFHHVRWNFIRIVQFCVW